MFFHFFQHWFSRCSNYSERQWSKYLLRNRHVIGGRATKKSDPEYGSLSQRIQSARPAHVPHVPLKFPHEPDQKFKSSIQPKLLISRADYRLKFIRLPFFFSDLIAPLRNRRHIVLAILGFANLMLQASHFKDLNRGFELSNFHENTMVFSVGCNSLDLQIFSIFDWKIASK